MSDFELSNVKFSHCIIQNHGNRWYVAPSRVSMKLEVTDIAARPAKQKSKRDPRVNGLALDTQLIYKLRIKLRSALR